MSGIFISYRREDTSYIAGRLHDRLSAHFGADQIFRDIDTIDLGADFVERIEAAVGSCDALVVVIGDQWLVRDSAGRRRLDRPRDFVRLEIATALKRNILVLPVLVEKAPMPSEAELPGPLKKLSRRNALDLTDARWQYEVQRLIEGLEEVVRPAGEVQVQPVPADEQRPEPQESPPTPPTPPAHPASGEPLASAGARPPRKGAAIAAGVAAAVVAAIVAAVVLISSGGDDGTPSDPSPAPPALEAIGPTASDVPIGWTANPPVNAYLDTSLSRCVGGPDQRTWPRAASPVFAAPDGSQGVSSATVRAPTADAASSSYEALVDRFANCARSNPENFAFAPGAQLRSVERRDVSAPPGVQGVLFRSVIDVPVGASTVETNVDSVRLQRDDVVVEMEFVSNGAPYPTDAENRLIETVAGRMG